MPLDDKAFAGRLKEIFDDMWNTAEGVTRSNAWYAEKLAKAINDEIRNGDVQPGIPLTAGPYSGATIDIGKVK
uniref:Uncharacterized protein n=1 Tax=uncultured bacterium contig00055 TaxID=1181539 RepID=A0A806K140_9BACT|nr:hypothetical protein [uncultured bacterium contig00055]